MTSSKSKPKLKTYLSIGDLCHDLGFNTDVVMDIASNIDSYYYEKTIIDKKGKERKLNCTRGLAEDIQKKIHIILSRYAFPPYMFGIVKGKSIKDNARTHIGARTILSLDVEDCFPSTSEEKAMNAFRYTLGYSNNVSKLLVKLTTYQGSVPQGTHSSSVVVALCLLPICREIEKLCRKQNFKVGVWADDIAISGDMPQQYLKNFLA